MRGGVLEWLGGPVFTWDLVLLGRRRWLSIVAACVLIVFTLLFLSAVRRETLGFTIPVAGQGWQAEHTKVLSLVIDEQNRAATDFVARACRWLLIGITFLVPVLAGARLCQEKEKDTLLALFGTELSSFGILWGKLLGTLAAVFRPVLLLLPLFVAAVGYVELPLTRLLTPLLALFLLAALVACATLLTGTFTRKTQEATLGTFAILVLLYLLINFIDDRIGIPAWLNPIDFNVRLARVDVTPPPLELLLPFIAVWGGLAALMFLLAVLLLQPLYLQQLEKKPGSWHLRLRPKIGHDPILWREQHLLGIAPLPLLRRVPTSLALLAVFAFSSLLIVSELPRLVGFDVYDRLREGALSELASRFGRIGQDAAVQTLLIQGGVLVVLSLYTILVRCTGCIADEKRMKTWDDIRATPLSLRAILQAKRRGILRATFGYLFIFAMPMLILAGSQGAVAVVLVAVGLLAWFGVLALTARTCVDRVHDRERRRGQGVE